MIAAVLAAPALVFAQSGATIITPPQGTTPRQAPTSTLSDANHTGLDVTIVGTTAAGTPIAPLPVMAMPAPSLPPPACNPLLKAAAQPCR